MQTIDQFRQNQLEEFHREHHGEYGPILDHVIANPDSPVAPSNWQYYPDGARIENFNGHNTFDPVPADPYQRALRIEKYWHLMLEKATNEFNEFRPLLHVGHLPSVEEFRPVEWITRANGSKVKVGGMYTRHMTRAEGLKKLAQLRHNVKLCRLEYKDAEAEVERHAPGGIAPERRKEMAQLDYEQSEAERRIHEEIDRIQI